MGIGRTEALAGIDNIRTATTSRRQMINAMAEFATTANRKYQRLLKQAQDAGLGTEFAEASPGQFNTYLNSLTEPDAD